MGAGRLLLKSTTQTSSSQHHQPVDLPAHHLGAAVRAAAGGDDRHLGAAVGAEDRGEVRPVDHGDDLARQGVALRRRHAVERPRQIDCGGGKARVGAAIAAASPADDGSRARADSASPHPRRAATRSPAPARSAATASTAAAGRAEPESALEPAGHRHLGSAPIDGTSAAGTAGAPMARRSDVAAPAFLRAAQMTRAAAASLLAASRWRLADMIVPARLVDFPHALPAADIEPLFRPRQGDIEQAVLLARWRSIAIGPRARPRPDRRWPCSATRAAVPHRPTSIQNRPLMRLLPAPLIGQEHDRRLQPLGAVHGDDAHAPAAFVEVALHRAARPRASSAACPADRAGGSIRSPARGSGTRRSPRRIPRPGAA